MAEASVPFKDALDSAILSFRCSKDTDIETFLHEKAIPYYQQKLCSVFLLLNKESFNAGKLRIDAYFTLSHKNILSAHAAVSSKNKGKITGGFRSREILEFVLIGQLGKHIYIDANGIKHSAEITGAEILDQAFEVMRQASMLIPSRCALVECSDDPNVRKIYEDYQFTFLQKDGEHNQYYKLI